MKVMFLPCPRKLPKTRGHNPKNTYAAWRNPMRDARRKLSPISGRQWVKFRKFGTKAYRRYLIEKTMGGIFDKDITN